MVVRLFALVLPLFMVVLSVSEGLAQQVIIDDDFSDGDFTSNPTWTDPESKHIINSGNQLQLDAPSVADTAVISTFSDAAFGTWDFWVNFDFNPSSTSFSRLYLVADTETLKGPVNGYYVRVGHTDDEVSLFRQDGNSNTKIIDGANDILDASSVTVRIRVTRDLNGNWELFADPTGSQNFVSQGSVTDNIHTSSSFTGIFSKYIGSRSTLYSYDDVRVEKLTPPLEIVNISVLDNSTLEAVFNLALDPATIDASDFVVDNGIGNPASVSISNPQTVELTFSDPIPGGTFSLEITDLSSINGNPIAPDQAITFSLFDIFEPGDVIINEFMFDPPSALPEYVELHNNTGKILNLEDWTLADSNSENVITPDNLVLPADSFLVISSDTTLLNNLFGARNYIQMSTMPALNNGGDDIIIRQADGTRVDSLTYTSEWGGSDVALERRSPGAPSIAIENWEDSPAANGGTPGTVNLVPADNESPALTDLAFPDNATLMLSFSERITNSTAEDINNFAFSGSPSVTNAVQTAPDSIQLSLDPPMANNTSFTLSIRNIEDIFGNMIVDTDTTFTFFEVTEADSGDILVNEFMYDPPDGFTEYVELINTSDKTIDLQNWSFNDAAGSPDVITFGSFLIPPGALVVLAPDPTIEQLFPGVQLIEMGSRFSALNNGGDQIKLFRADGSPMDSLMYNNSWGGEEVSLERLSVDAPSIFRENWKDSPSPDLGTPGRPNEVPPDNDPPDFSIVEVTNNSELLLVFSERIFGASDPAKYTLSPSIPIQNVEVRSDTVLLNLDQPLESGVTHTLTAEGITDLFGNIPPSPLETTFTFFDTINPQPGDLLVNEFMYDPPTGFTEYVEIINNSPDAIDLKDFMINDNSGSPTTFVDMQTILPSGELIAVVPDSTLVALFPESNFLVIGSGFQTLNNGGDAIILFDQNQTVLDSLVYQPIWGGEEVSLERKSTSVPSVFRENWGDSPSPDLGTPGLPNEIEPDNTPPEIISVRALNENRIRVELSERPDVTSATQDGTFTLTPSRPIQMVILDNTAIELVLAQPLITGQLFTLEVRNLSDLFGNILAEQSKSFELFEFERARPGDIVINEILFNTASGSDVEFVELFNRSGRDIDINVWEIGDSGDQPATISSPDQSGIFPVPANSFVVLTNSAAFADTSSKFVQVAGFPSLNDDEDAVFIRSTTGETIDSLFYNSNYGGDTDGFSLERIDPFGASNDRSNWRTSTNTSGRTPGRENSVLSPDKAPPKAVFSTFREDGLIEVRFSEFIDPDEQLSFSLNNDLMLEIEQFDRNNAGLIVLSGFDAAMNAEENLLVTIRNLRDFRGNTTSETSIPLSLPLQPGDIVFNEIMFDPLTAENPEDPSQSEYLELFNVAEHAVSLEGIKIFEERLPDGQFDDELDLVNRSGIFIPSGGHFLIYSDAEPRFEDSRISRFFQLDSVFQFSRVDASSLQLRNSGQPLILADSTGITIDSLVYSDEWHNPNIVDTKGISLERKVPRGPSPDGRNWGSASTTAVPEGGTPGQVNTLFTSSEEPETENSISIEPNPFSPNGDGKDDNLIINYTLSETDFTLRVRIYDRYGREIRTLADGEQAGRSGTLVWDGLDDDGRRNRIGYYIVLFEALNSASANRKTFKETVVLARQL